MNLIKYFLGVRDIFSAYLYSLALVHFNYVEVKAVDSFPRTKKDGVQREIVSYVHKNLEKRFFRGIRPDLTHDDNEISYPDLQSCELCMLVMQKSQTKTCKNHTRLKKPAGLKYECTHVYN